MIVLNDKKIPNPKKISLLLKKMEIKDGVCVILNGKIIKKDRWEKTEIKDGDKIEIVGFVGGG
ncbi:MAG: sulfur carrier protein ThiS [Elusimicrobiales bacterium]|jgi:sulfur carrier protein|nr:sulfur carrier protein ThiS [Elusimicrobiales bacterium]HOJ85903.1 sulfur carrier protein ThiS [Elusimicrobiales bacterium]HOL63074.1 sulfur carrier protein ThiS [Elusimicrobiales bacterium]HPO95460.1 sulfur carrier protein ThiS [Elusimicrobiales bacterium]